MCVWLCSNDAARKKEDINQQVHNIYGLFKKNEQQQQKAQATHFCDAKRSGKNRGSGAFT